MKINGIILNKIFRWTTLFTLVLALAGCQPFEPDQVILIKARGVEDIQPFSCMVGGEILDIGAGGIEQHGFCWSETQNPSLESGLSNTLGKAPGPGVFSTVIEDLVPNTTYYFRVYARGGGETVYSDQQNFTTLPPPPEPPSVITHPATEITRNSAMVHGSVVFDGGREVSARGFYWAYHDNPTAADFVINQGSGAGDFESHMKGLFPNANYFVRAFATNSIGTGLGDEIVFKTLPLTAPGVNMTDVHSVNENSARISGDVVDDGGAEVLARGFCWATHEGPALDDQSVAADAGVGPFEAILEGLDPYTHYFVRAYATNEIGTSYSEEQMEFRTLWVEYTPVFDIDGNEYLTVQIGEQVWMIGHLEVTRYADGSPISNVVDAGDWAAMSLDHKGYCYYDNNPGHAPAYGALYTWAAAMNGQKGSMDNPSGVQGVCPDGWHLPSDGEWMQLEMFLGMRLEEAEATGWRGNIEGLRLKSATTTHWLPPNEGASNSSKFHALPGGYRYENGAFFDLRATAVMWSSTEDGTDRAFNRGLYYDESRVQRLSWTKQNGMNVRCLKDY